MSSLPRSVPDASEFVLDEMGLEVALDRVLESARKLAGAPYAVLCALNDARDGLALFLMAGSTMTRARIGKWPCGRGLLGDLILDPVPLRLANLGDHPHCYGMPPGHPPMRSFLGVAILVDRVPDGSLELVPDRKSGRAIVHQRGPGSGRGARRFRRPRDRARSTANQRRPFLNRAGKVLARSI
jgi:signal transduction protein with GAF and PtsI domain